MEVYLTYSASSHGGEALYKEFYPEKLYLDRKNAHNWRVETIDVEGNVKLGDYVYLVVVRYSTGSTFDTTYGEWHMIGGYKNINDAGAIRDAINADYKYEGARGYSKHPEAPEGYPLFDDYKCWVGYFEGLQDVEIHPMIVI